MPSVKRLAAGVAAFLAVCGMGLFCCVAGGAQWGVGPTGVMAMGILMLASFAFCAAAFFE